MGCRREGFDPLFPKHCSDEVDGVVECVVCSVTRAWLLAVKDDLSEAWPPAIVTALNLLAAVDGRASLAPAAATLAQDLTLEQVKLCATFGLPEPAFHK
eukprot:3643813-Amphidinium_carterae.1